MSVKISSAHERATIAASESFSCRYRCFKIYDEFIRQVLWTTFLKSLQLCAHICPRKDQSATATHRHIRVGELFPFDVHLSASRTHQHWAKRSKQSLPRSETLMDDTAEGNFRGNLKANRISLVNMLDVAGSKFTLDAGGEPKKCSKVLCRAPLQSSTNDLWRSEMS